jgi:natural product precursor
MQKIYPWDNCYPKKYTKFGISILSFNLTRKKMKTLSKLKLNQFRKAELEKREMNALKGGCNCVCPCAGMGDVTNASDKTGTGVYRY